jgi:predicted glycoside hydrolase/deacetylase ChbG (UPF0249 family)
VHLHEGVFRVAVEEADRLGIPLRSRGFDVRERLRLKSIRTCDRFIDDFYGDDVSEDKLISILEALPDGTSELMCHPAREDAELASLSSYAGPRARELGTLTSPAIAKALVRLGIELVPMSRI